MRLSSREVLIGGSQRPDGEQMRSATLLSLVVAAAVGVSTTGMSAQAPRQSLEIYAVNVVKNAPFDKQFVGYGIYLGEGYVLTAAHVVGHWPLITGPRVRIAGENLPAAVVKEGSFEGTDLALLSIDKTKLPVSLRLRRNPLCKHMPVVGMQVVDVTPEKITNLQVVSPLSIPIDLQRRFNTLIDRPQNSGSGIFDADRKCLLGIVSAKVLKFAYKYVVGKPMWQPSGYVGYFVSAAKISEFLPQDVHLND
jgi:S1-C subfamily serine protease